MKALAPASLLAVAVLSIQGRAPALPSQTAYYATLLDYDGDLPRASDPGLLVFALDGDTGKGCRYSMEWWNRVDGPAVSVGCWVNEAKTLGATSCWVNSTATVHTMITKDPHLSCSGFDVRGQIQPVFLLVAAQGYETGYLSSILQYTAASARPRAFEWEALPNAP